MSSTGQCDALFPMTNCAAGDMHTLSEDFLGQAPGFASALDARRYGWSRLDIYQRLALVIVREYDISEICN
ncbi:MAG: hypothetical protein CM15mP120_00040 [Pseudomonadota bacterium]|nr:MAG: hypothetical protein CM15mP120_00040 [Pseudomonadota bacterium]